jgi:hypothetical protein
MSFIRAEEERNPTDTRFRRGSIGTGATSKVEKRLRYASGACAERSGAKR